MLSLQLKTGEYLTIGDDILVQIYEGSGGSFRVSVQAPRDMAILRGEVLERAAPRPGAVRDRQPKSPSRRQRDARQYEKLTARRELSEARRQEAQAEKSAFLSDMRAMLARMDGGDTDALAALRGRLDRFEQAAE